MRIQRGQRGYKRFEKMNRPPDGKPWCWLTQEMLESEAWRAMTLPARRVLDRLIIEHMSHGGTMNGELICPYGDFVRCGVSRKSISAAIKVAVALGFIDVIFRGHKNYGIAERPSVYGLTWLPRSDGTPPSNRWKAIKTRAEAESLVRAALGARPSRGNGKVVPLYPHKKEVASGETCTPPTPREDI